VPPGIHLVSEEEVLKSDVLIYCVSISSFQEVLKRTGKKIGRDTLVMDSCSVKIEPVRWMMEELPEHVRIIGTHPMFGPDSGSDGIEGLPMVLCPARIGEQQLKTWIGEFSRFGLQVLRMSADEHDHQAAYSQGITHFIGRVVTDLNLEEYPISTVGFQKMMEVAEQTCNDPFQLFLDLQRFNPYTGEMREKLHKSLKKMLGILDTQGG
jgi:prephenate dehydrogenase